jgi:hypothetical protein
MSNLNDFTRLFDNVKMCTELNWQEKAILSEIISYQLDGKPFKLKDITLAYELGMDKGTISKFVNRLHKKGLLNKTTVSFPSLSGGKPKRLRTITVINIELWTEKGKTLPTIKAIEVKPKKMTSVEIVETPVIKTEIASTETNTIQQDVKPTEPTKVVKEKSLEELLHEVDTNKEQVISNVLTLDAEKDLTKKQHMYEHIISEIQKGAKYKFIPVKVIHADKSITNDEAMQLPSMKIYALKSKLLKINPSLFD